MLCCYNITTPFLVSRLHFTHVTTHFLLNLKLHFNRDTSHNVVTYKTIRAEWITCKHRHFYFAALCYNTAAVWWLLVFPQAILKESSSLLIQSKWDKKKKMKKHPNRQELLYFVIQPQKKHQAASLHYQYKTKAYIKGNYSQVKCSPTQLNTCN